MHLKGYRFFADDEDKYGLEDILQALMFMKIGCAFVPAKPWQEAVHNKEITQGNLLSKQVHSHLSQMSSSAIEN